MSNILYALKVMRERGLGFFYTYFKESVWFDLYNGTQTSNRVPKAKQSINSSESEQANGLLYVASFTSVVTNTLSIAREAMGDRLFFGSQFVDLGCGKGKTLLVYTQAFGEKNKVPAIGIEYDPVLAQVATDNVVKCGYSSREISVVADSACNLEAYIKTQCLIIYLYNSFQGDTLRQVLSLLKGRPHVLIYVDPVEQAILPDYGYQVIAENHGNFNADTWLVAISNLDGDPDGTGR